MTELSKDTITFEKDTEVVLTVDETGNTLSIILPKGSYKTTFTVVREPYEGEERVFRCGKY